MAVVLEFRSRAAQLLRDQEKVVEQSKKMKDGYKESAKEAGQLERALQRVNKQTETPQERHNRKLKELSTLLASGRINMDQMKRATELYNVQLLKASTAGVKAFGPMMLGHVAKLTTGFIGAHLGAQSLISAYARLDAQAQQAADRFTTRGDALRDLLEMHVGDPKGREQSMALVRGVLAGGFARDPQEAVSLVKEARSADRIEELPLFTRLNLATDAAALLKETGKAATAFQTTAENMADISIGAAARTPGVTPVDMAKAITAGAALGSELGLSKEELGGLAERIGQRAKEPGQISTQLNALLSSFVRRGFVDTMKGAPLADMLARVEKEAPSAQEQLKFLGRVEAQQAFAAARDRDALRRATEDAFTADRANLARQLAGEVTSVPEVRALQRRRVSEFGGDTTFSRQALMREELNNLMQQGAALDRRSGHFELEIMAKDLITGAMRRVLGDERTLSVLGVDTSRIAAEADRIVVQRLDRLNDTLERIEANQSGVPAVSRIEGRQE